MRLKEHPVDKQGASLGNLIEVCADKIRFHPTDIEAITANLTFDAMSAGLTQAQFAALVIKELLESSE